jgi:hypothetical protein
MSLDEREKSRHIPVDKCVLWGVSAGSTKGLTKRIVGFWIMCVIIYAARRWLRHLAHGDYQMRFSRTGNPTSTKDAEPKTKYGGDRCYREMKDLGLKLFR